MIPKNNDIRFEVTTKCNYNCIICPRDKLTRKKETMSSRLFRRLLDKILKEAPQYTTVSFPGMGEPLLDESLDAKIAYARQRKMNILLLTNGFLLSIDRFKKLEDLGVESVRVSFYGNDLQSYAKIHGVKNSRAFDTVRDSLNAILKAKRHTKLLLTYNVIDGSNDGYVEEWVRYWKDRADLLEVWRPHNWVNGRDYRKIQGDKLKTCGRPFNGPLQVQVDGTVNMCCFDFDGRLTLGDLKTQSLKEIFSSKVFRKIYKCHKRGDFKKSGLICKDCDQRNKDKKDIMIYNSGFDIKDRIRQISTTYRNIL